MTNIIEPTFRNRNFQKPATVAMRGTRRSLGFRISRIGHRNHVPASPTRECFQHVHHYRCRMRTG